VRIKNKQSFTSQDLKDKLYATLNDVRSKRITPHVANSVAGQAREIMRIVRMEIQIAAMTGQKPQRQLLTFTGDVK
jgi:hypothetical protein